MLEGKEVQGKIGSVGSYGVDIMPTGQVAADLGLDINQDLIPAAPGAVVLELKVTGLAKVDALPLLKLEVDKITNPLAKSAANFLIDELTKLRAGQDPHPAIVAAMSANAAPSA